MSSPSCSQFIRTQWILSQIAFCVPPAMLIKTKESLCTIWVWSRLQARLCCGYCNTSVCSETWHHIFHYNKLSFLVAILIMHRINCSSSYWAKVSKDLKQNPVFILSVIFPNSCLRFNEMITLPFWFHLTIDFSEPVKCIPTCFQIRVSIYSETSVWGISISSSSSSVQQTRWVCSITCQRTTKSLWTSFCEN